LRRLAAASSICVALLLAVCCSRSPGKHDFLSINEDRSLLNVNSSQGAAFKQFRENFFKRRDRKPPSLDTLRHIVHYFNEPGLELLAAILLEQVVIDDPKFRDFALALIEDKATRVDRKIKGLWLLEYAAVLGLPRIENVEEFAPLWYRVQEQRSIDQEARRFAEMKLSEPFSSKLQALDFLIFGFGYRNSDNEWARAMLTNQISKSEGKEKLFWRTVTTAVTGPREFK
jgi:hypothetical protein